jgi:peptide/nickel transport system permease protein
MRSDAVITTQHGLPPRVQRGPLAATLHWPLMLARRKPLGFAGLVVLVVLGGMAAFAPIVAPYGYEEVDFSARLQSPSRDHIFGTDNLGRDLFSRIVWGTRVSFGVSAAAVLLAKSLGTVIALISGFYGGWFDKLFQRLVDIWIALPTLIILISLIAVLGASPLTLVLVVGLSNAPNTSRLVRSVVVQVREEPYVEAAQTLGARDARIMLQHILPNVVHIVIFSATVTLGSVILIVASLGFLGYGLPPPHPDLGGMLSGDGLTFMRRMPWMAVWPGVTITLIVFSFNVLGDALRDVLDPRLRGR